MILRKQGCYRYWPGKGRRSLQSAEHLGSIHDITMVFLEIADSSQGGRELWQVLAERPPTERELRFRQGILEILRVAMITSVSHQPGARVSGYHSGLKPFGSCGKQFQFGKTIWLHL